MHYVAIKMLIGGHHVLGDIPMGVFRRGRISHFILSYNLYIILYMCIVYDIYYIIIIIHHI